MCNNYNSRQVCLLNQLRLLWSLHVYWTRFFHSERRGGAGRSGAGHREAAGKPRRVFQGLGTVLRRAAGGASLRSCCGSI